MQVSLQSRAKTATNVPWQNDRHVTGYSRWLPQGSAIRSANFARMACDCVQSLKGYDEVCSPRVRVRVSLGGTSPRLLAMALDILGAVVPGPAPDPSNSPRSADGAPDRVLPPALNGKLPANATHFFATERALTMACTALLVSQLPYQYMFKLHMTLTAACRSDSMMQ